jgi:hypothetical protein
VEDEKLSGFEDRRVGSRNQSDRNTDNGGGHDKLECVKTRYQMDETASNG